MLGTLGDACGTPLLDVHADPDHHRAVFTLAGVPDEVEAAARRLARAAVGLLDLTGHDGRHPRIGVLDVVPFVPFVPLGTPGSAAARRGGDLADALAARDRFCAWAAEELALPCFRYGPLADGSTRTLPDVRRHAWQTLVPDTGPPAPHPTAGASAVGARPVLVA
ncbi:MAG: hypothetical protein ACRDWE_14400, partial [Acidimicrobiales bacterium]